MKTTHTFASEQALALEGSRMLKEISKTQLPRLEVQGTSILLPASALPLLIELLEGIGAGQNVSVTRPDTVLTTQQAAAVLGVSRPWLVQLLEGGAIPFHRTGTHRRILQADIAAYQEGLKAGQTALDSLTEQAQQHRMGYE